MYGRRFPAHHLVTLTVAPFSDGENPMQSYNSVLCHRALDLYADAIVLVSNDDAVEAPRPSDPRKAVAVPRVSIEGCNNRIAAAVVGALAPVVDADGRNGAARHCRWVDQPLLVTQPLLRFSRCLDLCSIG